MGLSRGELEERARRNEALAERSPLLYWLKVASFASLAHGVYALLVLSLLASLLGIACLVLLSPNLLTVQLALRGGVPVVLMLIATLAALRVRLTLLPGYRLTRQEVPALFALLDGLSAKLSVRCPELVLLDDGYNASVTERPRVGLFGREIELRLGMPLLQVVSKQELEAVLAHELSHIAARDGRFAGWIYRMVLRFENLLRMNSHAPPVLGFLRWYLPRLETLTLPLRKRQEYAADKRAAAAVSSEAMARALVRIALHEDELAHLWKQVRKVIVTTPHPPGNVFAVWGEQPREGAALGALAKVMKVEPEPGSSHPSLRERLRALGQPADVPVGLATHAAAELFGDRYPTLVEQAGWVWSSKIHEEWLQKHKRLQLGKLELERLEELRRTTQLDEAQMTTYAALFEQVLPEQDALPLHRAVLELFPNNTDARLSAARILVERRDREVVALLEPLISAGEPRARLLANALLGAFHSANEDEHALEKAKQGVEEAGSELSRRAREGALFRASDDYIAHGYPEEIIVQLGKELEFFVQLRRVYLVRKRIAQEATSLLMMYEAVGLIGQREVLAFEREIGGLIRLPEPFVLVNGARSKQLAARVRKVESALVFEYDLALLRP